MPCENDQADVVLTAAIERDELLELSLLDQKTLDEVRRLHKALSSQ